VTIIRLLRVLGLGLQQPAPERSEDMPCTSRSIRDVDQPVFRGYLDPEDLADVVLLSDWALLIRGGGSR